MNAEELKNALLSGCPVEYRSLDNTRLMFKCVSAIIYRKNKNGKISISAEVADRKAKSVCIVAIDRLKEVQPNDT